MLYLKIVDSDGDFVEVEDLTDVSIEVLLGDCKNLIETLEYAHRECMDEDESGV